MQLPKNYSLTTTDPKETGLRLFGITDSKTNITVYFAEFNKDFDVHASIAWAGARTSRSMDSYESIFAEINGALSDGKGTAGEKLAKVFVGYGHASVADMSPVMLYMNNIPMHMPFWLFNHTSVGGGQELSTRYVEIGDFGLPSLSNYIKDPVLHKTISEKWDAIQTYQSSMYQKWYEKIKERIEPFLGSTGEKVSKSTLNARILDIVRMWIPMGAKTSMSYLTSTRNWIDLVVQLREYSDPLYHDLAEQIVTTLKLSDFDEARDLKADLSGLTKYSEGKHTISGNVAKLKTYLESLAGWNDIVITSDRTYGSLSNVTYFNKSDNYSESELFAAQYIHSIYPNIDFAEIATFVAALGDENKVEIGKLILNEHMHHNLLRNIGDIRGHVFSLETATGYIRDLNRHRSAGRYIPMFDSNDIDAVVYAGYNKNHQVENMDCLENIRHEWNTDFEILYKKIYDLYEFCKDHFEATDLRWLYNILPLGHQVTMHMSSPTTQMNYINSLRISLGGDFGYRKVVFDMLTELRSDPMFKHMLEHINEPNVNSVEENLGRS